MSEMSFRAGPEDKITGARIVKGPDVLVFDIGKILCKPKIYLKIEFQSKSIFKGLEARAKTYFKVWKQIFELVK